MTPTWSSFLVLDIADIRNVFTEFFDEICQDFNISVPATGRHASNNATNVKAEYWNNDNSGSGSYGGSGGGGYGGGSWQRGAASSVAANALLVWMVGSVACAVSMNMVF